MKNEVKLIINCFLGLADTEKQNVVLVNNKVSRILSLGFEYKWKRNVIHIMDGDFEINIKISDVCEDGDILYIGDWILNKGDVELLLVG